MKIVFLDIDGTLNNIETEERVPNTAYTGISNSKVKLLKKIVEATDAQIVLSSTWRLQRTRWGGEIPKEHKEYLKKKLAKQGLRYISSTPDIHPSRRGEEIYKWLEDNNDITIDGWVVLDDERWADFSEYDILPHFILTKGYNYNDGGLSEEDVKHAIRILNGGLNDESEIQEIIDNSWYPL